MSDISDISFAEHVSVCLWNPHSGKSQRDGSDDGNGVKKSCGQAPAFTPASLAPVHSVETQALP